MMRWVIRWLAIGVIALSSAAPGQGKPAASSIDYSVYDAVLSLMQFPKQGVRIVIEQKTLNSGCGEAPGNTVMMNGCGIFIEGATPQNVHEAVQPLIPDLDDATWSSFVDRTLTSVTLSDELHSSWAHAVVNLNQPLSEAWKSPDGIILFSQVGYSSDRRKALVYVLFLSYMKQVPTSGNFFLFSKDAAGGWQPKGRATYMQTAP